MSSSFDPGEVTGPPAVTVEVPLSLEDFLPTPAATEPPPAPAMRTARVLSVTDRRVKLTYRGNGPAVEALVATEVDPEVVADACESGNAVLVETILGELPVIVGVLQTKRPTALRLRAATIQIEGDDEVLLRSGGAAIRLRADGNIEVVGSRISAASRGLFRLVGRILRLN